jgi:hypothetical protein
MDLTDLADVNLVAMTVWIGVPAAVLLAIGLYIRDVRALADRPRRRAVGFDVALLLLATAFVAVIVARFLLLT